MEGLTTIQISKDTRKRLNIFKIHHELANLDQVIRMLLNNTK